MGELRFLHDRSFGVSSTINQVILTAVTEPLPAPEVAKPAYQAVLRHLWALKPDQIALKLRDDPSVSGLDSRRLAEQVAQRRAVLAKVPAWEAVEGLVWPPGLAVEQASSEATACYKRRLLRDHVAATVLIDFSAGMGVDAWALGARLPQARLYEQQPELAAITQHNLRRLLPALDLDIRAAAAPIGAAAGLSSAPQVWFFDPARRSDSGSRLRDFADCTPNVLDHLASVPAAVRCVIVKAAPMLDHQLAIRQLESAGALRVTEVHIVARDGVCREVLYVLKQPESGWRSDDREFHAVDLRSSLSQLWSQRQLDGLHAAPLGPVEQYLFDPHAALRKLNRLGPLCRHYGVHQLAPETLLLSGPAPLDNFPGRTFRVVAGPLKKPARALKDRAASIVTRNFPDSAATLRRRWKLKESQHEFLFAFRDNNQRPVVLHAERVLD